jgi:hypothetical protein
LRRIGKSQRLVARDDDDDDDDDGQAMREGGHAYIPPG